MDKLTIKIKLQEGGILKLRKISVLLCLTLLWACNDEESAEEVSVSNLEEPSEVGIKELQEEVTDTQSEEVKQLFPLNEPSYLEEGLSEFYNSDGFDVLHYEKYGKEYYVAIANRYQLKLENGIVGYDFTNDTLPIYVTIIEDGKIIERDVLTTLTFFGDKTINGGFEGSTKDHLLLTIGESIPDSSGDGKREHLQIYDIKENGTVELVKEHAITEEYSALYPTLEGDVFVITVPDGDDYDGVNTKIVLDDNFEEIYKFNSSDGFIENDDYLLDLSKGYIFVHHIDSTSSVYDLNKEDGLWDDNGAKKVYDFYLENDHLWDYQFAKVENGFYAVGSNYPANILKVAYYQYDGEDINLVSEFPIESELELLHSPAQISIEEDTITVLNYVLFKGKPNVEKLVFSRIDK